MNRLPLHPKSIHGKDNKMKDVGLFNASLLVKQ